MSKTTTLALLSAVIALAGCDGSSKGDLHRTLMKTCKESGASLTVTVSSNQLIDSATTTCAFPPKEPSHDR